MRQSGQVSPVRRRARGALRGLLLAACFSGLNKLSGPTAHAAEPSSAPSTAASTAASTVPQLRVVQTMHNAPVGQIRADAAFQRLYTIAADKTLRIWRLQDLQLQRTVYLPAEPGLEGTPYALAVSADGRRAYVAGVTGWAWQRAAHIYVVDAERGRIASTLGRFDNDAVTAMDLSPDGSQLAVGLAAGGLRVLSVASGEVLHADAAYAGQVSFVHYARDGRLASTSTDGCVRVYQRGAQRADPRDQLTLAFRRQYPPTPADAPQCTGSQLGGVRFSPDGRLLAFGVRYRSDGQRHQPEVTVMDAASLTVRRVLRPAEADQQSLCCIAWSPDSRTLFVNGNVDASGSDPSAPDAPTPVYRVREPLTGALERWNVGRQQIANMLPLPGGQLILASTAPALTRVNAQGEVATTEGGRRLSVQPDNIDFYAQRRDPNALRLSADGRSVAFATGATTSATTGASNTPWLRADLGSRQLITLLSPLRSPLLSPTSASDPALHPARRSGAVKVSTEMGHYAHRQPSQVNGHTVALDREENVWSWAVHASQPIAALGTQWRLRLLDARGQPLPHWQDPPYLSAPAFHTAITADGKSVVVAVGDGTLRWFSIATGQETLGFFPHANGADWVAWRGDGYYASSPHGDQYVGWLVNRGPHSSPDLHRAVQFERRLYRPDLVRAALQEAARAPRGVPAAAKSTPPSVATPQSQQLAATLRQLAAPRVVIESIQPASEPGTLSIRFSAEATGRPISEVGVYVDGVPVLRATERAVQGSEAQRLTRTVTARVSTASHSAATAATAATNTTTTVRVEAETDGSLGMDESVPLAPPRLSRPKPGRLWVLAAGVSRFDGMQCAPGQPCPITLAPLPNTAHDARELAAVLSQQLGHAFSDVRSVVLSSDSALPPTRANLLAQLQVLEQAAPEDTVLVFFASHGFASGSASGEYYFVTQDATQKDLAAVVRAAVAGDAADGAEAPQTAPKAATQAAPEGAPSRGKARGPARQEASPGRTRNALSPAATPFEPSAEPTPSAAPLAPSLLSSTELYTLLRRVPGHRILVLDTCHAGAADGRSNPYSLFKRSASAQIAVLSASQGNELSHDIPSPTPGQPGHGVFTQALLEALQGRVSPARAEAATGPITLVQAFSYTGPRVAQLLKAQRIHAPQTPTLTASPALAGTVLIKP